MVNIQKRLDGEWKLYLAENKNCVDFANGISTEKELISYGFEKIPAVVPGNFELDLLRAGKIEDPFFGINPILLQSLENRHLWYVLSFSFDGKADNSFLCFEGIDTFADIFLNGLKIGSSDNMLISHEFAAMGLKADENELLVHLKPTCIEARKFDFDLDVTTHIEYNAASLGVRKAAHMFGWDIMPRFVSAGLWRSVYIAERKKDYIADIYLNTDMLADNKAYISGCFNLQLSGDYTRDYSLDITGVCEDNSFNFRLDKLWHNRGNIDFEINAPKLWWPRDMGKPYLYRVNAELKYCGKTVDTYEFNFGIRTVKLDRSENENGKKNFCFFVNGTLVFIRGTNWVPMDAFHSRDAERYDKALELLKESNCNAVRCWGGNVYEDHAFFDFCDKNGILVWQDFAMACATYPQSDAFAEKIENEVGQVVKKLRCHPSIVLWSGDNECDLAAMFWRRHKRNPNHNRLTREVIPKVLRRFDPWREYLPGSPYVDEGAFQRSDENVLSENHLWGPRDNYKGDYYAKSSAVFISETGYHGCPEEDTLKEFIPEDALWPINDKEWLAHSSSMELSQKNNPYYYRNGLMSKQIECLFGAVPDTLEAFVTASQISQAEAVKFFIERMRNAKWERTGVIWWNLIDGWPQISDAAVDYYYRKKRAFSYIKRSQQPLCLMFREPENDKIMLVGANEFLTDHAVSYTVTDIDTQAAVCCGETVLSANSVTEIAEIPYAENEQHFYLITWFGESGKGLNHYLCGKMPFDLKKYLLWLESSGLQTNETCE